MSQVEVDISIVDQVPNHASLKRRSFWNILFNKKESPVDTNQNVYSPLPENSESFESTMTYGRLKHFYKGNESQGNRFIGNTML